VRKYRTDRTASSEDLNMTAEPKSLAWKIVGASSVTSLGVAMVATALTAIPASTSVEVLVHIVLPH
jgi:hypothetical protein